MGEGLFTEAEILTEAAQINGMIVAFIEVRADDLWRFEEDGSRRMWWSLVSSVATLESLVDIYFISMVGKSFLSLVDCCFYCAVDAQAKVVVMEMNLI